jgi:hypothetical protein
MVIYLSDESIFSFFIYRVYKAVLDRDTPKERIASSERNFCGKCSSMLWLYDESW